LFENFIIHSRRTVTTRPSETPFLCIVALGRENQKKKKKLTGKIKYKVLRELKKNSKNHKNSLLSPRVPQVYVQTIP
jgi:hypothetical protein